VLLGVSLNVRADAKSRLRVNWTKIPMKYTPPPPPKPNDVCVCGHAYSEHVQAGASHGCQHGSIPPYANECSCKSFKQKKGK